MSDFEKIQEAEKWLYSYKSTKAGILNLTEKYEAGNKSPEMLEKINYMKMKIEHIDRALASLNYMENEIIKCKYIEGMYYYEFTYKVYKSERQCKRIKKIAMRKITIALGL